MTIRPLSEHDLGRVLEINEANVPGVGGLDADRLLAIVRESEIALAALADDALIGFCLVLGPSAAYDSVNYRWFTARYPQAYYLDRVAFDVDFQGQGRGTALYAEVDRVIAERRAAGAPIDRLTLEVNVDPPNEQSLAFHARRGFMEVGRQATPYGIEVSLQHKLY